MATVHLTRQQYRDLSEVAKSAGLALNLSTYSRMRCWGRYSPWALLVCRDTSSDEPQWAEHSLITLASSINTDRLRAAGPNRPELDWSKLEDHEIYPFVVWHEIGHKMDNVCFMDIMRIKDVEVRDECYKRAKFVNEILADRYAWEHIRPGEPIPFSKQGSQLQERAQEALAYLDAHAPRTRYVLRPLSPGQYRDIPDYMLATPERAAFVGPAVSRALLSKRSQYHREYAQQHGPLYLG